MDSLQPTIEDLDKVERDRWRRISAAVNIAELTLKHEPWQLSYDQASLFISDFDVLSSPEAADYRAATGLTPEGFMLWHTSALQIIEARHIQ